MSPGAEYALAAMVCIGLADLVYKRAASVGVQPTHFLMVQGVFFAPAIVFYAWATDVLFAPPGFEWGMAAGFFIYIALYNFAKSLASGAVSIVAPIFRLNFVLTAAFAIVVLGERITPNKIIGLALALMAVWLLLGGSSGGSGVPQIRATRTPVGRVLLATLAIAACNVCYKLGVAAGVPPVTMLVGQASIFVPMTMIVVWITDHTLRVPAVAWKHPPFAALLLFIGFPLLLESLRSGEASVLIPIGQMGFIVTALCGMLFMREPFTARKLAGLAVAAAALIVLAQG
jgi:drug/metabolite transporter (DMT)-like permease